MARHQRQTLLVTLGAVAVGLLIVAGVASQQLAPAASPSAVAVVVTPTPLANPSATPDASGSVAPGTPAATGMLLYQPTGTSLTPASIPASGRTLGDPKAPVTIDLYGDFRCSACFQFTEGGTAALVIDQLVATGKAKLVWHDFTVVDLIDGHIASRDAANAAWCAADQNQFWLMHDWLYVNQSPTEAPDAFTVDRLLTIGDAAGITDMATFRTCVQGGVHFHDIALEQASLPAGVRATPTTLVDGRIVPATYQGIAAAVDAALAGASAKPSASR